VLGDAYRVKFIERPRYEKKLPMVLSEEEIASLLRSVDNLKHRCMLMLLYAGGLRLSELIHLRPGDLARDRGQLRVRGGKGNKDRITLLSEKVLDPLARYLAAYRPKHYLFEGVGGGPYSPRSVQQVFHRAREKRASAHRPPCIPCGTASPHTCWRRAPTCATYRPSWAMPAAAPRRSTPT
jgi:integrase